MRKLYLCRHGKTAWNADRRIQGLTDIALNDEGMEQARWLADFMKRQVVAPVRIVSSPLSRAKQTAECLAEALNENVEFDDRAIEINTGVFTGKRLEELQDDAAWQQHLIDPWNAGYGDGGESAESVRTRIMSLIEEGKRDERDLIIVSHASPIRHAIMALLDIPPKHLYHIVVSNASATKFECREGFYKCIFTNISSSSF